MNDLRTAAQQALEFVRAMNKHGWLLADYESDMERTVAGLEAALAQEQAEPVEFLIEGNEFYGPPPAPYSTWGHALDSMIGARAIQGLCISALAQKPQPAQEPVAWQWLDTAHFRKKIPADATPSEWRPLYTTQPQRPPLTDEEIDRITDQQWGAADGQTVLYAAFRAYARAIEKKVKGEE